MNAASRKYNQPTLWDTSSATSSQGSGDGLKLFGSQGGLPVAESGQARAPVSHSAQQANGKAKKTKGTSGQSGSSCSEGITLSASESLSLSLVSRLRQRLGMAGSMEYAQTWKEKATPLGMRYWEHTASGHRTSGSDCTGWQSPVAGDAKGVAYRRDGGQKGKERLTNLGLVAGWPSPAAQNADGGPNPLGNTGEHFTLQTAATMAGWVSPSSRDWKDTAGMSETGANPDGSLRVRLDQLPRQARLTSGLTSTSSPAETEKRGVLNPEFVAWLMGYPGEWLSCVDWETLSSRKSQQSSSKRTCKPNTP